jgi:hypothetical protein
MRVRTRSLSCVCAIAFLLARSADAALINYGSFTLPAAGISSNNVAESSATDAVPLFGPPAPFVVGLDFDPAGFVASATGGASDITDGQLNFTVAGVSSPTGSVAVNSITLFEAGDYSMTGAGTPATQVLAGVITRVTVTEVDGVAVSPFSLFPVSASVGFNLVANPGIVQPWSLGTTINIASQLPGFGFGPGAGATRVEVVIDNNLLALSQTGSIAHIAKKDFRLEVNSVIRGTIPEPTTAALLSVTLLYLPLRRRPA